MSNSGQAHSPLESLRELGRRRWTTLLDLPELRGLVDEHLASAASTDADLSAALRAWSDAALAVQQQKADAATRFCAAATELAGRAATADRLGRAARSIQEGAYAVLGANAPAAVLAQLALARAASRDYVQLRNRVLATHLGLVHLAAGRLKIPPSRYDDMVHEGVFGLARALECFDPERGTKFSTYAMFWVRTEIMRAMTLAEREIRVPIHILGNRRAYAKTLASLDRGQPKGVLREMVKSVLGLTERQLRVVESVPEVQSETVVERGHDLQRDPLSEIHQRRLVARLWSVLPGLSPRERIVLGHRYELEGRPFRTLTQLGQELGLSRERVRQIQTGAMKQLREHLLPLSPTHQSSHRRPPLRRVSFDAASRQQIERSPPPRDAEYAALH